MCSFDFAQWFDTEYGLFHEISLAISCDSDRPVMDYLGLYGAHWADDSLDC